MKKLKYDLNLLNNCIEKDHATLIGSYTLIKSEIPIQFICSCGTYMTKLFRYIANNGGAYCKQCSINNAKLKRENTNKELFGESSPLKNKEILEKLKQTNLNKYGVEYCLKCPEIIAKGKRTNLEKYGNEIASKSKIVIEKMNKTVQSKTLEEKRIIIEKREVTNIKKYGVKTTLLAPLVNEKIKNIIKEKYGVTTNISQSKLIQNKIIKNCLQKYGVKNHQSRIDVKEKVKLTNIKRYGAIAGTCTDVIRKKVENTNIKKYGVKNPCQSLEIQLKLEKNSKVFKNYTFPSGNVIRVQGYEPFALDELITLYLENEILTSKKNVPSVRYYINNNEHIHYPDIFIPKENKLIEVKSTWTYQKNKQIVLEKAKECIKQGFIYELWVYDSKKNKQVICDF